MIVYVDSSVALRMVLGQRGRLREWKRIRRGIASALIEVECLRTLDRMRILGDLPDSTLAPRREAVFRLLDTLEIIELTHPVLNRAAQPMPTALGTLDALHLATALLWREQFGELTLATHDRELAIAGQASGLRVIGA